MTWHKLCVDMFNNKQYLKLNGGCSGSTTAHGDHDLCAVNLLVCSAALGVLESGSISIEPYLEN